MKNGSGYPDYTAYRAIKKAEFEYDRFRKVLGCIFRICELAGFSVEERIVLKDIHTGKVWK
jgi:hypothetical protein